MDISVSEKETEAPRNKGTCSRPHHHMAGPGLKPRIVTSVLSRNHTPLSTGCLQGEMYVPLDFSLYCLSQQGHIWDQIFPHPTVGSPGMEMTPAPYLCGHCEHVEDAQDTELNRLCCCLCLSGDHRGLPRIACSQALILFCHFCESVPRHTESRPREVVLAWYWVASDEILS